MRAIRFVGIVSCAAIAATGCATIRHPRALDTAKACAEWRWIGISRPGAPCPEVAGWTVEPLFPQLAAEGNYCANQAARDPELVSELNRFCVYEIASPGNRLQDVPFPPTATTGLVRFDQDCASVAFADRALSAKVWQSDYQNLPAQAGRPATPLKVDGPPRVRLAFLDTQPNGGGFPAAAGNSPHGYSLARLAQTLVCDPESDGPCAARITTRLALPIVRFDAKSPRGNTIDTENGGFLGMQSDLAQAIMNEVRTWQDEGSQEHLVLNLSLAWDDKLFGGLSEEWAADMKAGTQAVYKALEYAAERDVLVLAAAGNRQHAPCENDGPLLPAAWEKRPPREQECSAETGPKRLVYAVGGLESGGIPLANARHRGMPRRAAYGETALLYSATAKPPNWIYSGSSVATAVAASIAAVVWHRFPTLTSRQVMEVLDGSGSELFPADFSFDAPASPHPNAQVMVHRLSLCSALAAAACRGLDPSCLSAHPCPELPVPSGRGRAGDRSLSLGACQPFLIPQPDNPPCPICPPWDWRHRD